MAPIFSARLPQIISSQSASSTLGLSAANSASSSSLCGKILSLAGWLASGLRWLVLSKQPSACEAARWRQARGFPATLKPPREQQVADTQLSWHFACSLACLEASGGCLQTRTCKLLGRKLQLGGAARTGDICGPVVACSRGCKFNHYCERNKANHLSL